MNISPDQTMVFGDYLNDIEMLEVAKFSFAMKNAHEEVKKTAHFMTESNSNLGVEKIIEQVINSN